MEINRFIIHKTAILTKTGNRYIFVTKSYNNSSAVDVEIHIVDNEFNNLGRGSSYTVYNNHFKLMHENIRKKIENAGGKIYPEHSSDLDQTVDERLSELKDIETYFNEPFKRNNPT